ncbi:hypothetical protein C8Q78DRAFT_356507 [Trametes maxima]|nr:hypothetical protein C8Q78DRAFT_356507 [Trametes maxima]
MIISGSAARGRRAGLRGVHWHTTLCTKSRQSIVQERLLHTGERIKGVIGRLLKRRKHLHNPVAPRVLSNTLYLSPRTLVFTYVWLTPFAKTSFRGAHSTVGLLKALSQRRPLV